MPIVWTGGTGGRRAMRAWLMRSWVNLSELSNRQLAKRGYRRVGRTLIRAAIKG